MSDYSRWIIPDDEKNMQIEKLSKNLSILRAKIDVSQDTLAKMLGVSRQTYSSIELGKRKMTWQLYLAIVMVFNSSRETRDLLKHFDCLPVFLNYDEID